MVINKRKVIDKDQSNEILQNEFEILFYQRSSPLTSRKDQMSTNELLEKHEEMRQREREKNATLSFLLDRKFDLSSHLHSIVGGEVFFSGNQGSNEENKIIRSENIYIGKKRGETNKQSRSFSTITSQPDVNSSFIINDRITLRYLNPFSYSCPSSYHTIENKSTYSKSNI